MRPTSKTSGFTIVELIIAMAVAALVLVGLLPILINLFNNASDSIRSSKQVSQSELALNSIKDDLPLTNRFLVSSTITDTKPSGGAWDFRGSSSDSRVLLLETRATNAYRTDPGRDLVFRPAGGCPLGTSPVFNNVVYFVQDARLYRRTITEPAATYCSGQSVAQLRTCQNPGVSGAPANCSERDVVVADNVTSFSVMYYTNARDTTPISAVYNPSSTQSALNNLATLQVTLTTTNSSGGNNEEYTTQVRVSRPTAL